MNRERERGEIWSAREGKEEGERMKTTLRMPLDGIDGWRNEPAPSLPLSLKYTAQSPNCCLGVADVSIGRHSRAKKWFHNLCHKPNMKGDIPDDSKWLGFWSESWPHARTVFHDPSDALYRRTRKPPPSRRVFEIQARSHKPRMTPY